MNLATQLSEPTPKEMVFTSIALIFYLALAKWIYATVSRQTKSDLTPEFGSWFNLRDITEDVGIHNDARRGMDEGYDKFSKNGKPFWMKNWPLKSDLMMPINEIRRLMKEPDSVLSLSTVIEDSFSTQYTLPFAEHPTQETVVRKYLTKKLPELTADIMDEIEASLAEIWGTDTANFRDVPILGTVEKILARSNNRVFVGQPLCRNNDYLKVAAKFSNDVAFFGTIISLLPRILKPVLGRLLAIPNMIHYKRAAKYLQPHIRQRFLEFQEKGSTNNDFVTWAIEDAIKNGDKQKLSPEVISTRIITVNFASIHSSSFTTTNALLDILSSPPAPDGTLLLDTLRDEVMRIYTEERSQWTKTGVDRMVRVDSAVKESMRYSGILYRGVVRKVMDPSGYQATKDLLIPPGTNISVAAWSIHHDASFYENPHEYDALRFSRPREDIAQKTQSGVITEKNIENAIAVDKVNSLSTTSETFLAWGHGRKSCPGRYFATDVMRLVIASMVKDYEIEPLLVRPKNKWIMDTILPPGGAMLRIRRRQH
ncbi:Cytochrome P450 monooxygenase gloP [Cladobotryum mycophilum]|uniref:Cytochrome P450 monooxygenase gloP n=1 Tax=Cladobotryum mycophilum TaxID=491253 RepID=A0ABR0SX64_9HYPO